MLTTNTITTTGTPITTAATTTGPIKATTIASKSWYSQFDDLSKMLLNPLINPSIDLNKMLFNTNLSLPSKDIV